MIVKNSEKENEVERRSADKCLNVLQKLSCSKKSFNDPKRTNERCARIAKKIGPNISAPANFRLSNSIWRTFLKKIRKQMFRSEKPIPKKHTKEIPRKLSEPFDESDDKAFDDDSSTWLQRIVISFKIPQVGFLGDCLSSYFTHGNMHQCQIRSKC